jgi:uncharacterized protein (TIGR00730 family)
MSAPRICVYAATFPSRFDEHHAAARQLGHAIAEHGATAVYGGGCTGLMGAFADAALEAGADVVGVVPRAVFDLEREHGVALVHRGVTDLRIVGSMHERKAAMAALADAFVALPGSIGTIEELLESLTGSSMGLHAKPCWIINTAGYFDPLLAQLDAAADAGLLRPEDRGLLQVATDSVQPVAALAALVP